MNKALEIHDSMFAGTKLIDGVLVIHISKAYVHESAGIPGIDAGQGFTQEIALELSDPVIEKSLTSLPSRLSDGYISTNGNKIENLCDFPINEKGDIKISFTSIQNERFVVRGSRLVSTVLGAPEYVEEFKA
jgi:hypothetical protein